MKDFTSKSNSLQSARSRLGTTQSLILTAALMALAWSSAQAVVPGAKVWSIATSSYVLSSPAVGANGVVYFGSNDNNVYAVNTTTGTVRWKYLTGGDVSYPPTIGPDGTVYVGSGDKYLYALDGISGTVRWAVYVDATPTGIALGANGLLYVSESDGFVEALDRVNGHHRWYFLTGAAVKTCPAIGTNGVVYIGSDDNKLYALAGATGALLWQFTTAGNVFSPAIGPDGTVYIGSADNKVYAVNGLTGAMKWQYSTTGDFNSPVVGGDGTVYIGSNDSFVYALNGATGAVKGYVSMGYAVLASPAIGPDGTIYVQSGGFLNAITPALSIAWSYYISSSVSPNGSSAAIGPNGIVYVGSRDYSLYAIQGTHERACAAERLANARSKPPTLRTWVGQPLQPVHYASATYGQEPGDRRRFLRANVPRRRYRATPRPLVSCDHYHQHVRKPARDHQQRPPGR